MILVVLENQRGNIHPFSVEAVVAGQKFAKDLKCELGILCMGEKVDELKEKAKNFKATKLISAKNPLIEMYSADGYSKVLSDVVKDFSPKFVLMGHSYMVRDFLPRVSAKLNIPFVSDVVSVDFNNGSHLYSKQVFNAKLATNIELSSEQALLSFQSAAFSSDEIEEGGADSEVDFEVQLSEQDIRTQTEAEFQESSSGVDLTAAELIVSVGRGIESEDNIPVMEELANSMGAEVASSRPVVDMGWLPPYRQVGSSGQVVSPKLYFSVGISGAIQHVVGMKGSKNILAINKDEDAPIFEIADYAVVGDVLEIVPKLTEEIKNAT
jgi:electron transfer flavoprotein alpha subunit